MVTAPGGTTGATTSSGQTALVGFLNFDGSGNITTTPVTPNAATGITSSNLAAFQILQFSGTYTVNPDCSGTIMASNATGTVTSGAGGSTPGAQSLTLNFVELGVPNATFPTVMQFPELALSLSTSSTIGSGTAIAR